MMNLKYQLRSYIKERGISLSELSRRSGVARQTLHDWLSGVRPRDICRVKNVADVLNTSVDNLCFGREKVFRSNKGSSFYVDSEWARFEIKIRKLKGPAQEK